MISALRILMSFVISIVKWYHIFSHMFNKDMSFHKCATFPTCSCFIRIRSTENVALVSLFRYLV